jgi:hypothetical protein
VWEVWRARADWRSGIQRASIISAAMLLVLAPWLARNWNAYQTFFPASYQFSWSLWASNHSGADGTMLLTPEMRAEDERVQVLAVPERYAFYTAQAAAWMRAHPGEFAALALVKTSRLFGVKPDGMFRRGWFNKYIELGVPASTKGLLWTLAIVGAIFSTYHWQPLGFVYLAIGAVWLTTMVFSFYPRYLVPIIPPLAILAAYGIEMIHQLDTRFRKENGYLSIRARVALIALLVFALNAGWDAARNAGTIAAWQYLDTLSDCDAARSLSECAPGK